MNLNLKLNPTALMKLGRQFGPSLVGLALVTLFGYTGWVINQAFNVKPAEVTTTTTPAQPKVVFDKATIKVLKDLRVVPGDVAPADLGKTDPFGN